MMFFVFLFLLIAILGLVPVSAFVFKEKFNPISIINSVFGIWFILGRIGLFGQLIPTFESSVFLELNLLLIDLFVFFGYQFVKRRKRKLRKVRFNSEKIFGVFRVFCLIISLLIFLNLIHGLLSGGYSITEVRGISYSSRYGDDAYTKIYFNSFIYYFYQYVVRGFAFFDLTYCVGKILRGEKKIPLVPILNFILFILIMQSRIEFMKFVFFIVIFFCFAHVKLNQRQKRILKRSSFLLLIAVVVIFAVRSITSDSGMMANTISSFIVDFSGSNYTFSLFFGGYNDGAAINDSPLILKYLGGAGLAAERLLSMFGFTFDHTAINNFLIAAHDIGSSDHYNAFYTMYFDFMNSGGYVGCLLFSIILGMVIGYLYRGKNENPSLKSIYVASFATYVAIMGTYNYALSGIYALVIVCCIIMAKNDVDCVKINAGNNEGG